MAHITDGNTHLCEVREADLSGGLTADQFATTVTGSKTDYNIAIWLNGNVVDSGIPFSLITPSLGIIVDDSGNPVVDDSGNAITI